LQQEFVDRLEMLASDVGHRRMTPHNIRVILLGLACQQPLLAIRSE
jgi:hypothetical protein